MLAHTLLNLFVGEQCPRRKYLIPGSRVLERNHSLQVTIKTNLLAELKISTKHRTKSLTHQTGNHPVTCFVSRPSGITLVTCHSLQVTVKTKSWCRVMAIFARGCTLWVVLMSHCCTSYPQQCPRLKSRGRGSSNMCGRRGASRFRQAGPPHHTCHGGTSRRLCMGGL